MKTTPPLPYRILTLLVILSQLAAFITPALASPQSPTSSLESSYNASSSISNLQSLTSNPLSLSRVQTSYIAGQTIVEFTLTNNLPPTRAPDVPAGTTVTDTVGILDSFIITDDMNTLRGLTLVDTLAVGVTLLDASGSPAIIGSTLTWTLPDLPPQGTTTISMTIQTPAQGTGFVDLDTGAQADALQWNTPITTTARPAVLIPNSVDSAFALTTPDADLFDIDMLWKSAEFAQDPLAAFDYVKNFGYDPYKGSLRGTRGTLWGEAGNSADQSSLLIAMLRAAGIPARYRHGTLDTTTAQNLIESMFPSPSGVAGTLPAGTPSSDPINDPALIALVQDHWWVEAYLPGTGWTDLDPSFATAQPGDLFAAPGANDRIAELPDDIRHTITVRLRVERYTAFPIGGTNLSESIPLEVTFPTAQLASKRLTFAHLVTGEVQGGGPYTNVIYDYTPYFAIEDNDESYWGDPFQDFISNFPLSSEFTTAEWLDYELEDPNGNVETFTREVKDLIGVDARTLGGPVNLAVGTDSPPFALLDDMYVNWMLPNNVPTWVYERQHMQVLSKMSEMGNYGAEVVEIVDVTPPGELPSPEDSATIREARRVIIFANEGLLTSIGLDFAWKADQAMAQIETGLQAKMYYQTPRVFTVASAGTATEPISTTIDLRHTTASTIVYPGQALSAAFSANWAKGLVESELEGQALEAVFGIAPITTDRVFDEMELQGINPVLLTPNDYDQLEIYPFSSKAKARVLIALLAGKHVLIPSEAVSVDGQDVFAWWEFNPQTGETISVADNGLHTAALSYRLVMVAVESLADTYGGGGNPASAPGSSIIEPATQIGLKLKGYFEELLEEWENATSLHILASGTATWRYLPAHLCPIDNCGLEQFYVNGLMPGPIPLPEMLFAYEQAGDAVSIGRAVLSVGGSSGGNPDFTLAANPASSSTTPDLPVNFQVDISSNFNDDFTVMAYAPDGWDVVLGTDGSVTIQPALGTPTGQYTIRLVAQSNVYLDLSDSAEHTVTITALDTVSISLNPEPNLTVPMGNALLSDVSNQTNDGETEIAGAAYTILLDNPGQTANTYNVSVTGPPAGWMWLNGVQTTSGSVTLSAGESTKIGLYVQSPDGTVPNPGTNFNINVSAVAGGLSDSDSAMFTMPDQPFNFVTLQPSTIYLGSNSSTDFSVEMTNVGNGDGDFPILASLPPITASVSGLPSPITLAVGESQSFNATLNTVGIPLGAQFPVVLGSPAPGSYTQYAVVDALIVSEITEPVFIASDNAAETCTLGEPGLSDALESLALTMVHLEASCLNGDCDLSLRDQAASAAYNTVLYAGTVSQDLASINALIAAADDLASHTTNADILNDLQAISDAVVALDAEVCAWSSHKPALQWTPYYDAALVGQPTTYTLNLTNEGTLATTYNLTVTLLSSVFSGQYSVNPGETSSFDFPVSSPSLGLFDLDAIAVVGGQNTISSYSNAKLNVVDKFVQLTAVTPDPPFVETGVSSTDISITVANYANVLQPATAHLEILHPAGGVQYTSDVPVSVLVGPPRVYALGTVDTSGWETGVYTVSVALLDGDQQTIPDGAGYGYLGVGQAVGISHAVEPVIVTPGTVTVTTVITTEILMPLVISATMNSGQYSGIGDQLSILSDQSPIIDYRSLGIDFQSPTSTYAITRTEDTSPTIIYSGTWTTVNNIFSTHLSNGTYTWSGTAGDTATFVFTGTWVHIGFATERNAGEAEILIDGVSQGTVDLYAPGSQCFIADCLADVVYGGLTDTTHTLEIVVTGNSHPNATGTQVKLDHIDTWDGTTYPDGTFEQDNPRIWRTINFFTITEPAASGGSFMNDGAVNNNGSVWFPFTGDSASFVALARYDSHRVHVWVDGVWQGDVLIYSGTPISRTYSFSGFGDGPHIMRVSAFRAEPNIDAFITPAVGPDYDPPLYTGLVRYEENHPALRYNGYDVPHRPSTWSLGNAGQASEFSYMQSTTLSDTVGLTFDGSWLNIGLRTRNRGGLAEVFIDGVSYGQINAYTPNEDVVSYQYDLITGTHTLTITVLDQSDPPNIYNDVYLDYIEIWDGSPITDTFQNARKSEESGRVHISNAGADGIHANAIEGDFVHSGLPNSLSNVWYSFIGDSFTFYGLLVNNGGDAQVYVDGQLIDTITFDYPFSVQPFAFHYSGLDAAPHSVRIHNIWEMRVDGFASNQPPLPYQPIAEWWDNAPAGNGAPFFGTVGIGAGMAAGDMNGDGTVEIIVTSDNNGDFGAMFVYRGDGQDTGDGDPILWKHSFGGGVYRTWVSSPAIADLDGQPGAEIVVAAGDQLFAFHGDGSTYWITDTIDSIFETLTSPAIGNLDLDPEPEIVVNAGDTLEVRAHTGELLWSTLYPAVVNPPILADLTGDGLLDILVTGWDDEVRLYNFNYGSPQLVWTITLPTSMAGTFGAPAVADIDGLQPSGDTAPEVAISSNGLLTVLNGEDGSLVWDTPLDPGNPGGVSIADLDGDGEVEIVTGMRYEYAPGDFGMLYALNADGSILWEAIAQDSTSANNASVLDLDGDGIYEVAWNGKEQGFSIFSGLDGTILFNEPLVFSLTGTDYPLIADVDNDGQAEVVSAALGGIRVFGNGSDWGNARPLWNQHSYHITNVNDDLSIPFSEPDSWDIHNTYRTQTTNANPLPSYTIALTHTVGLDNVTVLTNTFNTPPTTSNPPAYGWDYAVTWENTLVNQTFNLQLSNLLPGESRMVAQGTTADYIGPGGANHLTLPPLFVSVPHIIDLQPVSRTVGAGASMVFTVTLTNPAGVGSLYSLSAGGMPSGWVDLPGAVSVPAGASVSVPMTVTVPLDEEAATFPFVVSVSTDLGANDQVGGILYVLGPLVEVGITPPNQTVMTGGTVTYTLTVTNLEGVGRTYDLTGAGLAPVNLPAQISVGTNSAASVAFTAQAVSEGANPFTVRATTANASGQDTASVTGDGFQQVEVTIVPGTAPSGPGVPIPFAVRVSNLGTAPENFALSVDVPAGWEASLTLLGNPVSEVLVAPGTGNAVELQLLVTPPNSATLGDYDFTVTAQDALVSDAETGTVQVGNLGVDVVITSGPGSLPPNGSGTWDVQVTNTGQQADTYDLTAFGPFAPFATLSQATVTLNPGASQTVQMTIGGFGFVLAGDYVVGLHAQSQTQAYIENQDVATLAVTAQEGVVVDWQPDSQSIDGTSQASFTLIVTNTGNVLTTFDLSVSASPSAAVEIAVNHLPIPARGTVQLLVTVSVPGNGTYTLTGTTEGGAVQGSDTATLTVTGLEPPMMEVYLPVVSR